ncbi:MAG: D-alanyl-D-alanine carboxypeptidase [Clostridiaceae bacterium]|nr:D-alanyl-D-alanine carboxypeptidase [Clostridiaceae bacterium]
MRKIFANFLCFVFIIMAFFSGSTISAEAQPFDISAKSAILMDGSTGTVLYEKNIDEALPPASVTKVMTMLLAMEAIESNKISLDDKVVISERASSMGGTQIYIEPGEVQTVENLMKSIAIRSANDASVAIAEHIAGTEDVFVEKMNSRAKELGMNNTHFINTNGLPAEGHVTSAYDIALMSRELLKHKEVHKWLTTWMDTVDVGKKTPSTQELVNTNRLIRTYKGITGIKTGSTSEAKYCLSASATRGSNSFIAVVMGAPTSPVRFSETAKLLDYGFATFNTVKIVEKGGSLGNINIGKGKEQQLLAVADEDLNVLVKKGDESKVKKEVILPEYMKAPIAKGAKVGEVIVTLDGREVGKVDIVTNEGVERASVINMMNRMFKAMVGY